MRRFELGSDGGEKFWAVALSGKTLTITWGAVGGKEHATKKKFASADEAEAEHDKLIREKLGKGYREAKRRVVSRSSAKPAPAPEASEHSKLIAQELVAQRQRAAKRIGAAKLSDRLPELSPLFRSSIRIATRAARPQAMTVGGSRIGGVPDLVPGTRWPTRGDHALAFVAQLRLDEVAPFDLDRLLPSTGLLSFFVATAPGAGEHANAVKVIHTDGDDLARLARAAPPDAPGREHPLSPCLVDLAVELTLPPPEGEHVAALQLDPDELERYREQVSLEQSPGAVHHRMLGHPDLARAVAHTLDGELLLQLDSDDKAKLAFRDGHKLCVYIPRAALASRAWQKATVIVDDE